MSPPRHHTDKQKYEEQDMRPNHMKHVRPAYEHNVQAPNQAMYSGGFRPNIRDEQYPRGSPNDQRWQDREKFEAGNIEERKDSGRIQKFDIPRASEHQRVKQDAPVKSRSATRESRSPRRDRSPLRDRYRRHSPSPHSPRRSWALEKRRSPGIVEAPPPPVWPGQDTRSVEYQRQDRSLLSERESDKRAPNWERKREEPRISRPSPDRGNEGAQYSKWKPITQVTESPQRFPVEEFEGPRDSKFRKKDFEGREDNYRREEKDRKVEIDTERYMKSSRENFEDTRNKKSERDFPYNKEEYLRKQVELKEKDILLKQEELQKEIDDVYKRAVDFAKKAQMYRKSEHKSEPKSSSPDRYTSQYEEHRVTASDFSRSNYKDEETRYRISDENFRAKDDYQNKNVLNEATQQKRNRAVDEITEKIVTKFGNSLDNDLRAKVVGAMKFKIMRVLEHMFGNQDVSFIEMVVKYNARHNVKDEEKIFNDVMAGFPSHYRSLKRHAQGDTDIPTKRPSPESRFSKDQLPISNMTHWSMLQTNLSAPSLVPVNAVPPVGMVINPPVMVPLPSQYQFMEPIPEIPNVAETPDLNLEPKKDGYSLYLCKDDFQPFKDSELVHLKDFLVQQLIQVTQTSHGWAPDFTINKIHNVYRYEVTTRDQRSRDWLLELDFSQFEKFNVLIYTTEELWYERAAIWLPGHSRCRNIEPLAKLKLQNKKLPGVNIGKWKFVKKVVTEKGTRVYVDMPPSSARALEKHKMMLSYELQKVNVFLKAVAVDKNAFDAGLNEPSILTIPPSQNCLMPSIPDNPTIIKLSLKGNKPLSLPFTRKIKDMLVYQLYKYHQADGNSRTDFVKYGFCQPGYFAVVPENEESKKWLYSLDLGKVNRQPVIIVGAENKNTRYFKMYIELIKDHNYNIAAYVCERLRQGNKGVKGINFNMWKNAKVTMEIKNNMPILEVDMDLESVETIAKMKFKLDYVNVNLINVSLKVRSEYSYETLKDKIKKYKEELRDSYVVANMDISSDESDVVIYE